MLAKARDLPADELVIDLEDAVAPDAKDDARAAVTRALSAGEDWHGRAVAVRVNAIGTPEHERDVLEIVEAGRGVLGSIVVPKVERPEDVELVEELLARGEASASATGSERRVGIQALIETAAGLSRADEIARAGERLESLIIGYADLAASLGRDPGAPGDDPWHHARESVLVAARAAGLAPIDGPHLDIRDLDGLRAAARRARASGYDGKWALHPTQIEPLNEVFTPTEEELERARAVLDALEQARGGDGRAGAVMLDGEMIDEASAKLAEHVVARAGGGAW
jgi:citrate lyase subunit beta/citryl-CoA lyase